MNEHCRIGLHSFAEWEDVPNTEWQTRACRECGATQKRPWEPDERTVRHADPYRDLMR